MAQERSSTLLCPLSQFLPLNEMELLQIVFIYFYLFLKHGLTLSLKWLELNI